MSQYAVEPAIPPSGRTSPEMSRSITVRYPAGMTRGELVRNARAYGRSATDHTYLSSRVAAGSIETHQRVRQPIPERNDRDGETDHGCVAASHNGNHQRTTGRPGGLPPLARCDSEPGHVVERPDLALMDYQPGESKMV